MKIKELWNKIRKGVKAGMAAATESNVLTDNRVVSMIEKFKASGKYKLMQEGERYYQADNDIKNRKITRKVDGHKEEETWRANNKLAHAKYKIQVDEKIAYLLTKPVTYKTDGTDKNDTYVEKVKDVLGKHFQYQLTQLGYEAKEKELCLSDAYIVKDNEPSLELKVKVINIRPEEHHEILEKCQVLKEYSQFMEIVQNYQISGVEEPYKKAIKECIEKGILADYLMRKISKWRTGWT